MTGVIILPGRGQSMSRRAFLMILLRCRFGSVTLCLKPMIPSGCLRISLSSRIDCFACRARLWSKNKQHSLAHSPTQDETNRDKRFAQSLGSTNHQLIHLTHTHTLVSTIRILLIRPVSSRSNVSSSQALLTIIHETKHMHRTD